MAKGFIGAVSNYKGGTGKTMTSVSLASALGIRGKRVLLIDADPQSDSTRALVQDHAAINNTIYELLDPDMQKRPKVEDCIYATIQENVDVLPNVPDTSGLEIPLSIKFPESCFALRNQVYNYVTTHYDYIFIDCPPTLSIFVSNAMYCADFVLIPMMAGSGNSLEGIKGVLDLMDAVRESGNPDLRFLKILVNKIDRRKSAHKANLQHAIMRFGKENLFKTIIPTSSDFETLESMRKATIFTFASRTKGAHAFRQLADEFLSIFEKIRAEQSTVVE